MAKRGVTLPSGERLVRETVEAIFANLKPQHVSAAEMREQAIAAFTKELDAKLDNLQNGEALQITYRVDIIDRSGRVRGGRGRRNRNMPEYIEWRKAVYERDNYTCQECGKRGGVCAHHIKPWSKYLEARFDVANGVSLCRACHQAKHPNIKIIGRWSKRRDVSEIDT